MRATKLQNSASNCKTLHAAQQLFHKQVMVSMCSDKSAQLHVRDQLTRQAGYMHALAHKADHKDSKRVDNADTATATA